MHKGVVVNAAGDESDPQDLLLLDSATLPALAGTAHTRAVPVEGVVATIQVKSRATPGAIRRALANVASSKRLLPEVARVAPRPGAEEPAWWGTTSSHFGGLLFLDSKSSDTALMDGFCVAALQMPLRERCDALCVLDRFAILWGDPARGTGLHLTSRAEQAETPVVLHAGADSLLFFYMTLAEHLRNWIAPAFNWMDYVFGPEPRVGREGGLSFQFSYYYDDEDPPDWLSQRDS
jgi:hypothetical protein